MSETQPWTIGQLLSWTTEYLERHGSDSPRLDAELLLAEVLDRPRIQLYATFEQEPDEAARGRFRELVKRRAAGEPVAYLLGRREFYSLDFRVTPDVLIPRPETEHLVVTLLDLARAEPRPSPVIADIGTGSGILAITLAKHLPDARITATDISTAALAVARENAAAHGVEDRIEFVEGDLFGGVPEGQTFDFVVSNPPYVSTTEMEQLPGEVHDHEPHGALLAGERGTEVIERLVPQAVERLRDGGHLLIEISPMIAGRSRGCSTPSHACGAERR